MSWWIDGRSLMLVAAFLSMFDRALLPPLVPVIARELDEPLESIGNSLVAYAIAYACMQLVWSAASTRWGRVRILATSTGLAAGANLVAALSADPVTLLVARGLAGAAFAATIPAVLVYFGDTLPMKGRVVATANLAASLSLGMTLGTLGAAAIAQWWTWRATFGLTALACTIVTVLIVRLPEPEVLHPQRIFRSIALVMRNRWAVLVLSLTFLEGILIIGVISYLPVSLQANGANVLVAGMATAAFGIAVIVVSQLMKLVIARWPSWLMLVIGGAASLAAYFVLGLSITATTVFLAAVLLGLSWALAHTTMQAWMTDAASNARVMGMSFFAIALFTGGSVGAVLGNFAATTARFDILFLAAAAVALVFAVASSVARARYRLNEDES